VPNLLMDNSVTMPAPTAGVPRRSSAWSHSRSKRALDIFLASFALLMCFPLMAVVAAMVAVTSGFPILFRQIRMGENGRLFELLKFRSMAKARGQSGPGVTRGGDSRITPIGRLLRRCKLDELPQLVNVLRGDMSLVGPRPDLPEFCQALDPQHRALLTLKPGLTGSATLEFRHEEQLLAAVPENDLVDYYVGMVLPQKAQLDLAYAERATFLSDLGIIWRTVLALSK
jgi:lipopolysaccharide/colanic/teichoic acid biosynthesis glycosyltransferase